MKINRRHFVYIILFLVIALGSWIRFSGIISGSFAFTYDVGRDLLEIRKIVVDHKIPLIGQTSGLPGLFYGPWWYYILTIPFLLSSGNPSFIVSFLALLGIACIPLAFIIGKKIGDNYLGIFMSMLISFSPYTVGLSNQIWNPNIAQIFIIILFLVLLSIYFSQKNKRYFNYFLLGILASLMLEAEIVFGTLSLIGLLCSMVLAQRKKFFSKNLLFFGVGFLIIQIPHILFEFRHGFIELKTITAGNKMSNEAGFTFPTLQIFINRIEVFFNMFADSITRGNTTLAIILIASAFFSFVFLYKKMTKHEKMFTKTCLMMISVYFIGILFLARPAWGHYLIGLPIIYILFFSFSLHLFRKLQYGKYLTTLFIIILTYINLQPLQVLADLNTPLWEGNAAVYRNQVAVIDYIYKDAHGKTFNYITYTPAVIDYPYQYLFVWYGNKTYGYVPANKKAELFYVIIEPDPDHPDRIEDWLNVRKGDGKIIGEKVVKGGIIVQKRVH